MPRHAGHLRFALLLCCCFFGSALAADSVPTFARVDTDDGGRARALQLAITRYEPAREADDVVIDLISAVHIGDKDYYQVLNRRFAGYDVVLYELVTANPELASDPQRAAGGLLSSLQIGMKDALGLAFQLDEIDYGAANLVHADLSGEQLLTSMDERGESLYVYFWRLFYTVIEEYARDPLGLQQADALSRMLMHDEKDAFKIVLAEELVRAAQAGDFLGNEQGSALIAARNERAIEVLREQIARGRKRIGIFYGAAHMPDFDKRLTGQLGMQRVGEEWQDAWRF